TRPARPAERGGVRRRAPEGVSVMLGMAADPGVGRPRSLRLTPPVQNAYSRRAEPRPRCAASRRGSVRLRLEEPAMSCTPVTRNLTPKIIHARIADDTHPVSVTACVSECYGVVRGRDVTPGMSDDTSGIPQVLPLQGEAAGMPGKVRIID